MARKRIVGLLLSSIVALGVMLFSNISNSNPQAAFATDLVGTPEVSWNNVDYSRGISKEWAPNVNDLGIPQNGYCLLALYPSNISANTYVDENLLTASVSGCNVGTHVVVNGVQSQNVVGAQIYCYPKNGFYIYVPYSSVAFSDEYEYVTVEVLEGMSIDGSAQTVATRFEYRGLLGSFGNWQVNPEPVVRKNGQFSKIDWNNVDYSYTLHQSWCGDLTPVNSPANGYCLLAFFNEEGKTYSESVIGDVTTTGRGVIGIGLNVDRKVKVNGVDIIDVDGALCYIYPAYGLFFYIPEASLTYDSTYMCPTIHLEPGIYFKDVVLPEITFEFRGELGDINCWAYYKNPSEYHKYDFVGVANGWNNVPVDATHNHNVLQFGEYGEAYLKDDHISDETNLVSKYSDIGTKITVNGIPLWQIEDSVVSYAHGYCYFYLALPVSALSPSNGYRVVTLHIEEDTLFYDTLLPEVNLYLFNGAWVYERPETPSDSDYDVAYSFSATFDRDTATLDSGTKQIVGTKESSIDSFGLFLDYKLANKDSAYVLYAMGTTGLNGIRLVFIGNTVSLYDSTEGNVLLGQATLEVFSYDEWFSLLLYTKVVANHLTVCVAVDDITYIHADNVNLADQSKIGNKFSLNLGAGSASFKNATQGGDNKKPVLSYSGKAVYGVLAGSDIIDFTDKCSAYDVKDGDVSNLIQYNWPTGSVTGGKINKGTWVVMIVAYDIAGNNTSKQVTVVAADKLDVTVTFDGQNPMTYRIGDNIAAVPDPVKPGCRFIGWYYNDRLWDFENDYVVSDTNLVSRFVETAEEHCVSFTVEGLKGVGSYYLYFAHGTTVEMSVFAKEGYTLKAYVDNNEVESITVTQNMEVKLVYTSTKKTKKGCSSDISSSSLFIPVIAGAALIVLVFIRMKRRKEHE